MLKNRINTIGVRLVLPVPIFALISVIAAWLILPPLIENNVRNDATLSAVQTANQFKKIRGYYTKNVVKKVLAGSDMKPSFNHATEKNAIPLPATFIHDMGTILAKDDTNINLYSAFPFPNREDRKLDDYQQQAWSFLNANPDATFSRQVKRGNKDVVRVAIADRMTAQACVSCHNARPDTPKADWNLGDVRGVLEVSTVITPQLTAGSLLSNRIVAGIIIVALLLIAMAVLVARTITRPLNAISDTMNRLSQGDLDADVPCLDRRDEIGVMAAALQVFKASAAEKVRLESEARKAAAGTQETNRTLLDLVGRFREAMQTVAQSMFTASTQVQSTAQDMATSARSTDQLASNVAAASDEADANVCTVSSAAEEMASSVEVIRQQVTQSSEIAQGAKAQAGRTNEQVARLVEVAGSIGHVINLISDIAEQTNLLALNATIEAARAGEAGKGFAVVASEVKTLANETAKATGEISSQIEMMQSATTDAATEIRRIGETIDKVNEIAGAIATAVDEQGSATQEIAQSIGHAANGTREVKTAIAGIAVATGETGDAATQVLGASDDLLRQVEKLRGELDQFLDDVKAI